MTLAAMVYLARVMGVEMFGAIGFAAAVASYFMVLVDAGLDLIGMREIARRGAAVEEVVASIFATRLVLAVMAVVLLWVIAPLLAPSPAWLAVILAYGLTLFSFACNLKWGFQALERNGLVAAAMALSQLVYLVAILVLVKGPEDALKVPALVFAAELVGAALLFVHYRRLGLRLWSPRSRRLSVSLIKEALPLAGTRAVRALTANFDLLLLGLVDTALAVGLYTAISRIILALRELGDLYYIPMFPGLSRAAQDATGHFASMSRTGIRYAAVIIFPIAVGGCLTAPQFLSLVFGAEYASGSSAFCLLLFAMVFGMLGGTYRMGFVAYGRQGTVLRIMTAGAALNVGLNLVLIPRYSIVGGAFSALVTEALIFFLGWMAIKTSVAVSPWSPIVRPAFAAGGMGAVIWLLPPWPFPATFGIAAVSYIVLVFLVGAVRPHELAEAWRERL